MAKGQTRTVRKIKPKHRAVKPRAKRPLDQPKADNHAARHEAKKAEARLEEARLSAFNAELTEIAQLQALGSQS